MLIDLWDRRARFPPRVVGTLAQRFPEAETRRLSQECLSEVDPERRRRSDGGVVEVVARTMQRRALAVPDEQEASRPRLEIVREVLARHAGLRVAHDVFLAKHRERHILNKRRLCGVIDQGRKAPHIVDFGACAVAAGLKADEFGDASFELVANAWIKASDREP
jgi:hypothetical protein